MNNEFLTDHIHFTNKLTNVTTVAVILRMSWPLIHDIHIFTLKSGISHFVFSIFNTTLSVQPKARVMFWCVHTEKFQKCSCWLYHACLSSILTYDDTKNYWIDFMKFGSFELCEKLSACFSIGYNWTTITRHFMLRCTCISACIWSINYWIFIRGKMFWRT
jgi:hypothetical protein